MKVYQVLKGCPQGDTRGGVLSAAGGSLVTGSPAGRREVENVPKRQMNVATCYFMEK